MRREGDGQKGNLKDGTEASRPRKDMDRPHGLVDLFIWRLLISHPRLERIYGLPFFFFFNILHLEQFYPILAQIHDPFDFASD